MRRRHRSPDAQTIPKSLFTGFHCALAIIEQLGGCVNLSSRIAMRPLARSTSSFASSHSELSHLCCCIYAALLRWQVVPLRRASSWACEGLWTSAAREAARPEVPGEPLSGLIRMLSSDASRFGQDALQLTTGGQRTKHRIEAAWRWILPQQ